MPPLRRRAVSSPWLIASSTRTVGTLSDIGCSALRMLDIPLIAHVEILRPVAGKVMGWSEISVSRHQPLLEGEAVKMKGFSVEPGERSTRVMLIRLERAESV